MVQPSRVYNEPESRLVMVEISPCYHCLPSDRSDLMKVLLGKCPRWWWMVRTGGAGGRLIILILSFDWVTVLTFGSSPVHCPATVLVVSWWYFHEYWNHFHNSTQNIPGTIKKIFIVYGRDSGWCCISSFHLLFKSLLNIPRGPSTARISLH